MILGVTGEFGRRSVGELHRVTSLDGEDILFDPSSLRTLVGRLAASAPREADGLDEGGAGMRPLPGDAPAPPGDGLPTADERSPVASGAASDTGIRRRLRRLTLHVANTCNLACSYCYASGGHYNLPESLMAGSRASYLLGEALRVYDVERVMFFGGEPSLNPAAIAEAGLLVRELHRRGHIAVAPSLAVISNLAGVGDRFAEFLGLCSLLNIHVTASIDGPPEVHDANRRDNAGQGSYARVRDNFQRARDLGLDLSVECTYTRDHLRRGITVLDLMRFFRDEFGLRDTHIVPMLGIGGIDQDAEIAALVEQYCDAIQYMIATDGTNDYVSVSFGHRILAALSDRKPIEIYCPAGHSELAIDPDGYVYPCFMFAGNLEFRVGSVDAALWPPSSGRRVLGEIERNDKTNHPVCRECWARGLCSGCIGGDYYQTGALADKPRCGLTKGMAAEAIVRLTERGQDRSLGYYGNGHRLAYLHG